MLIPNHPRRHPLLQLQTHPLQIYIRVTKRHHIVPIPRENIHLQSLLQESRYGINTALGIRLVLVVDVHVADTNVLSFARSQLFFVGIQVVFNAIVVRTPFT